jgi:glycosyltransferase involved in cell wall biosynthesis
LSHCSSGKHPLAAIAAFRTAFGDRSGRLLVLKAATPDHFPREFALLCTVAAAAPNIRIDTRTLPAEDHAALISACDIVLSLHRAQGLGFVTAEAMRLGKSVIATGWPGNMVSTAAQVCRSIPRIRPGPDCVRNIVNAAGGTGTGR